MCSCGWEGALDSAGAAYKVLEGPGSVPTAVTRYRFVNDAYVHGLMGGEAMECVATGDRELEDIVLV